MTTINSSAVVALREWLKQSGTLRFTLAEATAGTGRRFAKHEMEQALHLLQCEGRIIKFARKPIAGGRSGRPRAQVYGYVVNPLTGDEGRQLVLIYWNKLSADPTDASDVRIERFFYQMLVEQPECMAWPTEMGQDEDPRLAQVREWVRELISGAVS